MVLSKDLICKSRDGRSKMIMIDDDWWKIDAWLMNDWWMIDDNDDDMMMTMMVDDDMIDEMKKTW